MHEDAVAEVFAAVFAVVFVIAIWVTPILLGIRSALRKGISPHWMWFGIHPLGGWIAFIVIACMAPRPRCPRCGFLQSDWARFCARCGFDIHPMWGPPPGPAAPVSPAPPFAPSTIPPAADQGPAAGPPPQVAGFPPPAEYPPPQAAWSSPQVARPFAPPSAHWVQAPPRPTIVTVLGVLGLIAGIAGVLATPFTIAQLSGGWRTSPAFGMINENPVYRGWMILSVPLGLGASVFWIFTGTGLLRLQRWAHSAAVWLLVYNIAMGAIGLVVTIVAFFVLPVSDAVRYASGQAMVERSLIAFGGIFGGLLGIVLAAVALHYVRQPSVERAFRGPTQQGGG